MNVLIFDPRTNRYLVDANYPARWSPDVAGASSYSFGQVANMKKEWPYLCECTYAPDEPNHSPEDDPDEPNHSPDDVED